MNDAAFISPAPPRRARDHVRLLLVAVVALATVLTSVPPAAHADGQVRPRTDQEAYVEWRVANAISGARQSPRSVDPGAPEPAVGGLVGWSDLRAFARDWSDDMADRRTMSHNPAFAEGYCCWKSAGEVLATLDISSALTRYELRALGNRAVRAWFNSASHRRTILEGAYDQVGVGVTIDHDRQRAWVVADFRQVMPGEQPPGSAWYRPGGASPSTPSGGFPCNSDIAPYDVDVWPVGTSTMTRRSGEDRVETALNLASDIDDPTTVLVASSATPTDALAAAGLAGVARAPMVLTDPHRLDGRVADQLHRWSPDEVLLLGGSGALSRAVWRQVDAAAGGATVRRLQGADRFATAAAVARAVDDRGGNTRRVLLALGSHPVPSRAWADAVTVSGFAASHRNPVLLTAPSSLPGATRRALADLDPGRVIVAGGSASVSDRVLDQVRAAVPDASIKRVAGRDRYETTRKVVALDQSLRNKPTDNVHVVDSRGWPDALTAGPSAARHNAVVALVDGGAGDRGGGGVDLLGDLAARHDGLDITLIGGRTAIPPSRADAIVSEVRCVE